jgi:hypothetical protein
MGFSTLSDIFRVNLGTAPTLNSGIILITQRVLQVCFKYENLPGHSDWKLGDGRLLVWAYVTLL